VRACRSAAPGPILPLEPHPRRMMRTQIPILAAVVAATAATLPAQTAVSTLPAARATVPVTATVVPSTVLPPAVADARWEQLAAAAVIGHGASRDLAQGTMLTARVEPRERDPATGIAPPRLLVVEIVAP